METLTIETTKTDDQIIIEDIILEILKENGGFEIPSPRQMQAAYAMATAGLAAKGLGEMLGISYRTIDSYLAQIYACTGERNERALLAAIIRKLLGQMAELRTQLEERNV